MITADVSTAFMYAEVEEDACDLVLLPSNISYKGERVVCLLFKAMNGLRRAPLLWFYQLQRTVYHLGGEDTFESTLFRLSTKRGLVLILVYVDDLLIAAQNQDEGFMCLFMCVLQWISIYEIHFGSRGYSFAITCNFLSICMRLLRHCTCVCQKFTSFWHLTFPFRCN